VAIQAQCEKRLSAPRYGVAAVTIVLLVATAYSVGILWGLGEARGVFVSYDIYGAQYPNVIYILESLHSGHGLLWNTLQNCGEPFIPATAVGMFYPLHWLFIFVDIPIGFLLLAGAHLAIAGLGAYFLCREMQLGRLASLCGAIAWQISGPVAMIAAWSTFIMGTYVWLPAALLFCERLLTRPSVANAIGLGIVLTLQLLPGYPQVLFFTYQLLMLRLLWDIVTLRTMLPARAVGLLALGMLLPVGLGAVQLFPMIEFAQLSVRSRSLTAEEMMPGAIQPTWEAFRAALGSHVTGEGTTFVLVPAALALLGLAGGSKRRLAAFYLLVTCLSLALVFNNPISELYRTLPGGAMFRFPSRFLLVTGFAFSLLSAFGVQVLRGGARESLGGRMGLVLAPAVGAGSFWILAMGWPRWWEWMLLAAVIACCARAAWSGQRTLASPAVLTAFLLALDLVAVNFVPAPMYSRAVLYKHQDAFEFVRRHVTLQDRMHQFGKHPDYSIMPKSALVFGIPSILDYEPQTSRRYAEVFVRMMDNAHMASINQYLYRFNDVPRTLALYNLLASRFLVVEEHGQAIDPQLAHELRQLWVGNGVRVYENARAMPRAFYVPRIEAVESPSLLLDRLSGGSVSPRQVALVEEGPADGFVGSDPQATGTVAIESDNSEVLRLRVKAEAAGFLFMSDQYYPGWHATVNGVEAPIQRANYAFRLVRVPAGSSTVVFRYVPVRFWSGLALSMATLAAILGYGWFSLSTRWPSTRRAVSGPSAPREHELSDGNSCRTSLERSQPV